MHRQNASSQKQHRKKWLAPVGVLALSLPLLLTPSAALAAEPYAPPAAATAIEEGNFLPEYVTEYVSQVDSATVYEHVRHLSVDIGPRLAGSPAEAAGFNYVQPLLDSYGYQTSVEEFEFRAQKYATAVPSRDLDGAASWQFRPATNIPLTGPDAPVTGEVVDAEDGADIPGLTLTGKYALVNWISSTAERNAVIEQIHAAGAVGVIFTATSPNGSLVSPRNVPAGTEGMMVVGTGTIQGERIRAVLASDSAPLSLSITTDETSGMSNNVLGVRPAQGESPETAPIVYIGAHIDSVLGSPGASDNASGVGIMLEVARIMSNYDYNTEIRVGAWGAEEGGIAGSRTHAESLTAEEIERTIGAWNMDMAGTAELGTEDMPFSFWGLSVNSDNEDNPVLNTALEVATGAGHGEFDRGYVGRSDHQSFHDVGIPAAVFSWMFWSADSSIVLEPAYHKPSDTIDLVSQDRMGISAEIIGGSAFQAALNEVDVTVVDEDGTEAADVPVAMSCGEDEGWRSVGSTDAAGSASTIAPHTTCDFAAVAENGATGVASAQLVSGSTEIEIMLVLDETAPVVTISHSPEASTETGWHVTSPVNVTVTAVDDYDESPVIEYSFDEDQWEPYTGEFQITEDNIYSVFARATDGAGNVGEALEIFFVDTVAPTVSAQVNESTRGELTVKAMDETSGIEMLEYRLLPDGEWLQFDADQIGESDSYVGQIKLGDKATQIEFRATDFAGNVSALALVDVAAASSGETPGGTTPSTPGTALPAKGGTTLPATGGNQPLAIGLLAFTLLAAGGVTFMARRRLTNSVDDAL